VRNVEFTSFAHYYNGCLHMRNVWFTSYDHAYHISLHMPIKWLFSCEKCRIYISCPLLQWLSSHAENKRYLSIFHIYSISPLYQIETNTLIFRRGFKILLVLLNVVSSHGKECFYRYLSFCRFSVGHCVLLQFTDSDYAFGIIKLFLLKGGGLAL
jgi:hypothetical protein